MQAALHSSDSNREPPKLTFVICTPDPNLEACALACYYQTLTHPAGGRASFKQEKSFLNLHYSDNKMLTQSKTGLAYMALLPVLLPESSSPSVL